MLSNITFDVADRLITTLMTLVGALTNLVTQQSASASTQHAAQSLLQRLITLAATIIRLDHGGTRTPPKPSTPADTAPEPRPRPDRAPTPRPPPGWLLELLPGIAPAVAADLAAILADPAFASLLEAAPTLHHALRPFLRGLGLTLTLLPTPSPPSAPRPGSPPIPTPSNGPAVPPSHSRPPRAAQPKTRASNARTLHVQFVT